VRHALDEIGLDTGLVALIEPDLTTIAIDGSIASCTSKTSAARRPIEGQSARR
jgi:hypothetical protein